MPGDLIKLIDTQADWQSGTLQNLDATATPGVIIPTGDYAKTYDSQADWDAGAKSSVVSTEAGDILLDKPVKGNTSTVGTVVGEDSVNRFGQRISARGLLSYVAIYVASSDSARVLEVRSLDGALLWSTSFDGSGLWSGNPNLIVDEDVLVCAKAADTLWVRYAVEGDYPPGVTENGRRLKSDGSLDSYFSVPLYVQYKCEYAPSGTWTSPWLAHSIASPESGLLALTDEVPSGTSVTAKTRYSSDGGGTYTEWYDLVDGILQNVTGTHVQVQLTLATSDTKNTPVVDKAVLLVGKIHRWTSPAIDLAGVEADATLMLPTSQTELDVVREIREYPNFDFARSSTAYNPETGAEVAIDEPRYVAGAFEGSQALLVEEGTQNLLSTPFFDSDTNLDGIADNWIKYSPHATATWSIVDHAGYGGKVQKAEIIGEYPYGSLGIQQSGLNHAGKTLTFRATGITNKSQIILLAYDATAGTAIFVGSFNVTPDEDFDESITFVVPETCTSLSVYVYCPKGVAWAAGDYIGVYAAQLEAKPYATSFTDGTRSPELATIPTAGVCTPDNFHLEFWAYIDSRASSLFNFPRSVLSGTNIGFWMYRIGGTWVLQTRKDDNTSQTTSCSDSYTPEGWHYFKIGITVEEASVCIDGVRRIERSVPYLPSGLAANGYLGRGYTATFLNNGLDDVRFSSLLRSDAEALAAYQSNQPLPVDEHTTYKMAFDGSWKSVGMIFPRPAWQALQARLTLTKTGTEEQSLDSMALWECVALKMRGRPRVTLSPPEITHVKVYVEDSEPLVEYTASLDVRADQRVDHPPIAVPAGSSETYCQQVAEAVLAAKSKERVSLQCVVPLVTRLRFGELVPVVLPYMGYTRDEPYMARVQRMEHDVLRGITTLALGDFLPEDEEALVRLLKGGK